LVAYFRKEKAMRRSPCLYFLPLVLFAVTGSAGATELRTLSGEAVSLDSLLTNGPVVINFWATWCGPCRLEMPRLEAIYEELHKKGVEFAAVSLDNPRLKDRVRSYVEKNKITFPVYLDSKGELARKFKVVAIPTTVVLAKNGEVVYQTRGYRPGAEIILKKKIEGYLKSIEIKDAQP